MAIDRTTTPEGAGAAGTEEVSAAPVDANSQRKIDIKALQDGLVDVVDRAEDLTAKPDALLDIAVNRYLAANMEQASVDRKKSAQVTAQTALDAAKAQKTTSNVLHLIPGVVIVSSIGVFIAAMVVPFLPVDIIHTWFNSTTVIPHTQIHLSIAIWLAVLIIPVVFGLAAAGGSNKTATAIKNSKSRKDAKVSGCETTFELAKTEHETAVCGADLAVDAASTAVDAASTAVDAASTAVDTAVQAARDAAAQAARDAAAAPSAPSSAPDHRRGCGEVDAGCAGGNFCRMM